MQDLSVALSARGVSRRRVMSEACDVPIAFGCRTGVCHNCETGLLAGSVKYACQPLEEPPEGRILVCCSRPAEDLIVDA